MRAPMTAPATTPWLGPEVPGAEEFAPPPLPTDAVCVRVGDGGMKEGA